jgi:hypothetical protein
VAWYHSPGESDAYRRQRVALLALTPAGRGQWYPGFDDLAGAVERTA